MPVGLPEASRRIVACGGREGVSGGYGDGRGGGWGWRVVVGAEVGAGEELAVDEDGVGWRGLALGGGGQQEKGVQSERFHVVESIRPAVATPPPAEYYA